MASPLLAWMRAVLRSVDEFVFAPRNPRVPERLLWARAHEKVQEEYERRHAPLPDWLDRLSCLAGIHQEDGILMVRVAYRRRHLQSGESFHARLPFEEHADVCPYVIHTDPETGAISHRRAGADHEVILLSAFVNHELQVRWDVDVDPATIDPDELGWQPPEPP